MLFSGLLSECFPLLSHGTQAVWSQNVFLGGISAGSKHGRGPLVTIESAPSHFVVERTLQSPC